MSATRRARPRAPSEDPNDLPPYEPLELTLSDNVARSLNALATGRDSRRYEEHIRKATTLLGRNVAAANDRLAERQGDLQTTLAKRAARGAEKTPADLHLEAWIAEFQAEVAALTTESEAAVRDLVDRKAAAQDEKDAIAATADHIQTPTLTVTNERRRARPARRPADPHPRHPTGRARGTKAQAYAALPAVRALPLQQRLRRLQKVLARRPRLGDQNVPAAGSRRAGFDRDAKPRRPRPRGGAGARPPTATTATADGERRKISSSKGEIHSFICPAVACSPLTQPVQQTTSGSHTFQKESIQAWFAESRNQERTCPTTGCNVQLKLRDFYGDDLILRKILRQKKRLAAEAAAAEEIDDESDEDESAAAAVASRQKGKAGQRRRNRG
ncbi:conserved hypothetical protein [Verticillium alfalfae VaMs.102]|uniref:SP-RING-type domain-containing protein n=1 Tax=Verticillium alfalfae (strain VaMs.102 / ATCC MYA-4576 / FGSC 10136) TaxID=526221 RepID=C9SSX4_VERA1|nr:conserved hypothetical protein [Verticillium alfalfae VaMs.102]EEY21889.1 conserved hypothetical protein [Verticillium alfalfae VaMs.102]